MGNETPFKIELSLNACGQFSFNFFRIGAIFIIGGIVSPNKNPQGLSGSTLSQISFIIASSGMERNMPGIPHNALPAITIIIEKSALIFTFEATILGMMKLLSTN